MPLPLMTCAQRDHEQHGVVHTAKQSTQKVYRGQAVFALWPNGPHAMHTTKACSRCALQADESVRRQHAWTATKGHGSRALAGRQSCSAHTSNAVIGNGCGVVVQDLFQFADIAFLSRCAGTLQEGQFIEVLLTRCRLAAT